MPPLTLRDPVHGFIEVDDLEAALLSSTAVQRLRNIRQLGLTAMVFHGAEHSRFSHTLGAMHLAGRLYEAIASQGFAEGKTATLERRLARAAALLHDVGHAPFSHTAEDLFEESIDHEEMTRRLIQSPELESAFDAHGNGITSEQVIEVLNGTAPGRLKVLCELISGELDVDKMDYLLRDSLFCGVQYGRFDLERLLATATATYDANEDRWGLGLTEGGVHAFEALVLARYYMFTQVYFNTTGKVLELHFNRWLEGSGRRWSCEPELFLRDDDITVTNELRSSDDIHAKALTERRHFRLVAESRERIEPDQKTILEQLITALASEYTHDELLVSNAAKDPHRLDRSGVLVRYADGSLEPMATASQFIRHLERIDRYRLYAGREHLDTVRQRLAEASHDAGLVITPS